MLLTLAVGKNLGDSRRLLLLGCIGASIALEPRRAPSKRRSPFESMIV
nr:MAG TPA: hypothetical protein [Caudoviricetes sp.]